MELLLVDETFLSTEGPTPVFDKFLVANLRQVPQSSQRRVLRAASLRRPVTQSSHEEGALRDLPSAALHVSPRRPMRSGSTDPWSTSGFVEDEYAMERSSEDGLDDSDSLVEPKLEIADEDVQMDDLQEASSTNTPTPDDVKAEPRPRKRGRPRKHPVPNSETPIKLQKGRSKTGCITCRRRKKKCDETKPSCINCEKNAVICEGYLDKRFWKSGKERGEEGTGMESGEMSPLQSLMASTARRRRHSLPTFRLAPIIHGVETSGDRIFFEHYIFRLSAVLTVEGPKKNAFKDILLPLAIQHLGLMHSILALSSTNIEYEEPYGQALLAKHPGVSVESLKERAQYHWDEAWKDMDVAIQQEKEGIAAANASSIRYGQMLCLVVRSIAEGKATGEHRIHLRAYQKLIRENPPDDGPFMAFIEEYFQFHIGLDDIISLPQGPLQLGSIGDDGNLPAVIQPEAVRLLGVQDGLFFLMSKITSIRNTIRSNMENKIDPIVDYTALYRAAEIDVGIREWRHTWEPGDSRELAGRLYKQMMWVYLWRTIYPPKTTTWQPEYKITEVVNDGLALMEMFPPESQVQTLLLAPTFLIGCAAFDPAQRPTIRRSVANIRAYTHLKNADRALDVLEEVWRYMDAKDERSWDWQTVAHDMGMDFLAT